MKHSIIIATKYTAENIIILQSLEGTFYCLHWPISRPLGLANSLTFLLLENSSNFVGQEILKFRQRLTWFSVSHFCRGSQVLENQECFDPWAVKQPKFQEYPFVEFQEKVSSQILTRQYRLKNFVLNVLMITWFTPRLLCNWRFIL